MFFIAATCENKNVKQVDPVSEESKVESESQKLKKQDQNFEEVPSHGSPDQREIDSIKQAGLKDKK